VQCLRKFHRGRTVGRHTLPGKPTIQRTSGVAPGWLLEDFLHDVVKLGVIP
jgi:hypothetical protein